MNPRVLKVKPRKDYKLDLIFTNGEKRIYDCTPIMGFGIFTELKDLHYFLMARPLHGTVVWPHGQDICPDTLYLDSAAVEHEMESKSA